MHSRKPSYVTDKADEFLDTNINLGVRSPCAQTTFIYRPHKIPEKNTLRAMYLGKAKL